MIKHIVMYKLNDPTEENKNILVEKFMGMKGKIPCLLSIESGVDVVKSDRSFDVVLVCSYATLEDLETYRVHPVHLPVFAYVKSVVKESKSVDYII